MTLQLMRRVGVIAILVTGGVHLQQYVAGYHSIPTIGPLFLLNAISCAVVAVGLLVPIERWLGERAVGLFALTGVAIAVGSLVGLYIAETGTLFGFSEGTLEPVMWIAIVAEVAATVLLVPVAIVNLRPQRRSRTRSTSALSST